MIGSAHGTYSFQPLTHGDGGLVLRWRSMPHVREWWGPPPSEAEIVRADPRVAAWIVSRDNRPFAVMQDYTVHGWDGGHHFDTLPEGTRGIDQFIGWPDMLGLGHGTGFVGARMADLFAGGAPLIATDPHPDNRRAIAAYEKLDFRAVGPPRDTRWGPILPMIATRRGVLGRIPPGET